VTTTDAGSPYVDPVRRDQVRRKAVRDVVIASASLVAFVVVAVVLVSHASGWPLVQETFFNGEVFRDSFPEILSAFWLNVKIFLVAEPLILVLGLAIALARGTRAPVMFPLRVVATVYTDIFRGVPTILLVLLLGFGVPALSIDGLTNEPVVWGTVALVVSYSAYVAEVFRAGIESIHPSQRAAARSLGLSSVQTSRYVVLPQAIRRVVPPLLNDFISLQKDTALVSVIGPIEALRQAQIDSSFTFNFTPYVVAALLFIALTVPMTRFADWLNARAARERGAGVAA
jgi:polar amino acid transport system permease protein